MNKIKSQITRKKYTDVDIDVTIIVSIQPTRNRVEIIENNQKKQLRCGHNLKTVNQIIVDEFINYHQHAPINQTDEDSKDQFIPSNVSCKIIGGMLTYNVAVDANNNVKRMNNNFLGWLCGEIYVKSNSLTNVVDTFGAFFMITTQRNKKSEMNHVFFGSNVWPHKYPINKYYLNPAAFKSFQIQNALANNNVSIENKLLFHTTTATYNTSRLEIYALNNANNAYVSNSIHTIDSPFLIDSITINQKLEKQHFMTIKSIKDELIEKSMTTQQTIELLLFGGEKRFDLIVLIQLTLNIDSSVPFKFKYNLSHYKIMYGRIGMQLNTLNININPIPSAHVWVNGISRDMNNWNCFLQTKQLKELIILRVSIVHHNYLAFVVCYNFVQILVIIFDFISQNWYVEPEIFRDFGCKTLDDIFSHTYMIKKHRLNQRWRKSIIIQAADIEKHYVHKQQIQITWPISWHVERIIWIGFYKNGNNKNCKFKILPKDIVIQILTYSSYSIFNGDQYSKTLYKKFKVHVENKTVRKIKDSITFVGKNFVKHQTKASFILQFFAVTPVAYSNREISKILQAFASKQSS